MTDLIRESLQTALGASFTLGRELGGGGMSRVFIAHDGTLGRDIVVKLLSPELAQSLSVERFGREIALAAALQHANIVPVLSAGATAEGLPYYLMPFIEGSSLRDLVADHKGLPISDVLLILNDVSRALAYAHSRGVVHRDIKPDNVMLSGGAALVTDFGIAKAMSSARTAPRSGSAPNEQLTQLGTSIGTSAYMAPEQGAGDPDTDHRADIYSLGAMAYELLTGRPPFGDRPAHAQLVAHMVEAPAAIATHRADVPEPLAQLVMQCLEKDPDKRPQQATAILDRLANANQVRSENRTGSHTNAAPAAGKGSRAKLLVAAAFAVAVVAGGAWFATRSPNGPSGPDATLLAVMPFTVRDDALGVWREGLVDILARSLDGAGTLRTVSPSTSIAQSATRADVTTATALGNAVGAGLVVFGELNPVGRDSVRARVALVDVARGVVQHNVDVSGDATRIDALADSVVIQLLRALGSSGTLAGGTRLASMGTSSLPALKAFLQGQQFYRRGVTDSSLAAYESAVAIDSLFALAWRGVASVYIRTGREALPEAQAALDRAIRLRRGGSPRDSLLLHGDSLRLAVVRRTPSANDAVDDIPGLSALFATLTEATRRYPSDAELWLELGDAGYHFGEFGGRADSVALNDFERAIALDTMMLVPQLHAYQLALRLSRFRDAARYARGVARLAPQLAPYYTTLATVLDSAPALSAVARAHLDTADARTVAFVMQEIGNVPEATPLSQIVTTIQLQRLAQNPALPDSAPFARYALMLQAKGGKNIASGAPLTFVDRTQLARIGLLPTEPVLTEARQLLTNDPNTALAAMPLLAAAGDTVAVAAMIGPSDSLDAQLRTTGNTTAAHRGDLARAYLALARGDSASALRTLLSLPMATCGNAPCAVLTTAPMLMAAKRNADAARVLDRALPSSTGSITLPRAMALRAEVAERMSDRSTARYWYQRVIAQWGAGDAAVQPAVQAARAGLGRVK